MRPLEPGGALVGGALGGPPKGPLEPALAIKDPARAALETRGKARFQSFPAIPKEFGAGTTGFPLNFP